MSSRAPLFLCFSSSEKLAWLCPCGSFWRCFRLIFSVKRFCPGVTDHIRVVFQFTDHLIKLKSIAAAPSLSAFVCPSHTPRGPVSHCTSAPLTNGSPWPKLWRTLRTTEARFSSTLSDLNESAKRCFLSKEWWTKIYRKFSFFSPVIWIRLFEMQDCSFLWCYTKYFSFSSSLVNHLCIFKNHWSYFIIGVFNMYYNEL